MARKKRKGFAKPGSTVTRKVGKRTVTFKANSSSARIPGKLVPRFEKPDNKSNSIPGRKKKKKRKTVAKRRKPAKRKRVVRRKTRAVRKRKHVKKRTHKKRRRK